MNAKNQDEWVSATATHNYFNEPLLDWFKYAYKEKKSMACKIKANMKKITNKGKNIVNDYICQQGNMFESEIVKLIYKRIGKQHIVKIDSSNAKDEKAVKETLKQMKLGKYIILSGVVHNKKNKTYGIPDILIRSDVMNLLVDNDIIEKEEAIINAPTLGVKKWHYRVIDIKYMTLQLRSDGKNLLNSGHLPAYKAQLRIYNQALGKMQGYEPDQAYLLGRRWVSMQKGKQVFGDSCFDKLGIIDYQTFDVKYIDMTKEAVKWVKLCRTDKAKTWNVTKYPLERKELYPNMSNQMDGEWRALKEQIASNNYELTSLWNVGKKHRDIAISNGIYGWNDADCCAQNMGIKGKIGQTVNQIILINQEQNQCKPIGKKKVGTNNKNKSIAGKDKNNIDIGNNILIQPKKINCDLYNWKIKDKVEFFIDFEYKNAVFDQYIVLPVADKSQLLFTIGVGHVEPKNQKWVFKHFTVEHLNEHCEYTICQEFLQYMIKMNKKFNVKLPNCWHWSPAEPTMFRNVLLKHVGLNTLWKKANVVWCDMLKIFKEEPIVIKGCFNFKLKSVAKAMYDHGFISSLWEESKITDGQNALIHTVNADKIALKQKIPMIHMPVVQAVVRYNETDVKVLQEILHFLRSHNKGKTNNIIKRKLDNMSDSPAMNTRSVKRKL